MNKQNNTRVNNTCRIETQPRQHLYQHKLIESSIKRQYQKESDSKNKRMGLNDNDTLTNTSEPLINLNEELMEELTSIHSPQISKIVLPEDTTVSKSNIVYKDNPTKTNISNNIQD